MAESSPGPMAGKTVVVTGGTGGIGRAIHASTPPACSVPGLGFLYRDSTEVHR